MKEIVFEIKLPIIKFSPQKKFHFRIIISALILAGVFFAKDEYNFTLAGSLILTYFILSLIWRLPSQIAAFFSLLFLISCPILIYLDKTKLAELSAICAYYFLVITVLQEFFSILFLKKQSFKKKNSN